MPAITAVDRPLFHAAISGNDILAAGITQIGDMTISGMTLLSDADENAFLGKVAGKAGSYAPLPNAGEWLEAGSIYAGAGGLVIVRQSHSRTEHAPADVPALFVVYREGTSEVLAWIARENVLAGMRRTYSGKLYEALQPHVTQSDWQPNAPGIIGVLWREVVEAPTVEAWQSGTTYAIDTLVTRIGRTWKSLMNGNAGNTPGVVGTWRDQSDPPMWVQPAGSVGLWQVNDVATHQSKTWRCTSANNSFAPGVFGWVEV